MCAICKGGEEGRTNRAPTKWTSAWRNCNVALNLKRDAGSGPPLTFVFILLLLPYSPTDRIFSTLLQIYYISLKQITTVNKKFFFPCVYKLHAMSIPADTSIPTWDIENFLSSNIIRLQFLHSRYCWFFKHAIIAIRIEIDHEISKWAGMWQFCTPADITDPDSCRLCLCAHAIETHI